MNLAEFDIDLLANAGEFTEFTDIGTSTATRVEVGVPTHFTSMIGDNEYDFTWTLKSAKLTRLSQLINPYQNRAGHYNLMTGAMSGVTADLVVHDGDQSMDVDEFIFQALNHVLVENNHDPIAKEIYTKYKQALNIDWHKPLGLVFQHFAAHQRKMNDLFEAFIEMGASDVTDSIPAERRKRIERIISHSKGIDVSWMEVGKVSLDPERNPRQQGFQDFLNSVLSNTSRLIGGYVAVSQKRLELTNDALSFEEAETIRDSIRRESNNLRQWVNNWGGAQRQLVPGDDGQFHWNNLWGATNVPCGRFGLSVPIFETVTEEGVTFKQRKLMPVLDDEGIPVRKEDGSLVLLPASSNMDFDVWKSSADDPDADPPAAQSATVVDTTTSVDEEV